MHKSDMELLNILVKEECTNELKSHTINKILTLTNYKYSKIRKDLTKLQQDGYVQKGLKLERADTYYITPKGINKLKEYIK